jgi:thiamine biosynthesis protein ThiS
MPEQVEKGNDIEVVVNGDRELVPSLSTVAALIERFEEGDTHLIVQRNGRCVYPQEYESAVVEAGDRLEFIHPAFGG